MPEYQPPMDNSEPSESKHQEKLEAMFESIDAKVQTINELISFIQVNSHLTPEDLKQECGRQFDLILESQTSEVLQKRMHYVGLISRRDALINKKDLLLAKYNIAKNEEDSELDDSESFEDIEDILWDNAEISPEDRNEGGSLIEQIDEVDNEVYKMLNDIDVEFLHSVETFLESIINKRLQVRTLEDAYKRDPQEFYKKLCKKREFFQEIELDSFTSITFEGYDIVMELSKNDFRKIHGDGGAIGLHLNQTPISIVMNHPDKESVVQHEKNHNLTESFIDKPQYADLFEDNLKHRINRWNRLKFLRAPDSILDIEKNTIIKSIKEYIYNLEDELVAEMHDLIKDNNADAYVSHFLATIISIEKVINTIEDPGLQEAISIALKESRDNFVNHINMVTEVFYVAKMTGSLDNARAALLLFESRKVKSIRKYMIHIIGEERYNFFKYLKPLLGSESTRHKIAPQTLLLQSILGEEGQSEAEKMLFKLSNSDEVDFFTFDNIQFLSQILEKLNFTPELQSEDMEKVRHHLNEIALEYDYFITLVHLDVNQLKEYRDCLELIIEKFGAPLSLIKDFEINLYNTYLYRKFSDAIERDDFSDVKNVFLNWPFTNRPPKEELFLNNLSDILEIYDGDYQRKYPDIKESPLWHFLQEINIADKFSEADFSD